MSADKARIRKSVGNKSMSESVPLASAKRTSKVVRKGSAELVTLDEGEQMCRPPAKRARLFSQERVR